MIRESQFNVQNIEFFYERIGTVFQILGFASIIRSDFAIQAGLIFSFSITHRQPGTH